MEKNFIMDLFSFIICFERAEFDRQCFKQEWDGVVCYRCGYIHFVNKNLCSTID
jgi:hypothetical protein